MKTLLKLPLELWRDGSGGGGMNRNAIGPGRENMEGGP